MGCPGTREVVIKRIRIDIRVKRIRHAVLEIDAAAIQNTKGPRAGAGRGIAGGGRTTAVVVVVGGVELGRGTGGIVAEAASPPSALPFATNLASAFHVVRSRRSSNISNHSCALFVCGFCPWDFAFCVRSLWRKMSAWSSVFKTSSLPKRSDAATCAGRTACRHPTERASMIVGAG